MVSYTIIHIQLFNIKNYKYFYTEHDYITIQEATEGAIVRVAPIDRDETELDEYDIEITACETKNITSCTPLEIRFYISDINDQTPVIDSISNENDTFITVTDKSISLKFDENYNQDLQFSFDILDKDTVNFMKKNYTYLYILFDYNLILSKTTSFSM